MSPIGSEASLLQVMTPTLIDPIVQQATNETFFGSPIRPQSYDDNTPRSELYWNSSEGTAVQKATEALNSLTGGSKAKGGLVDVSPEDVEHWLQFIGGGIGRTAGRAADSVGAAVRGEVPPLRDIPIIRNFTLEVDDEKYRRTTFFEETDKIQQFAKHVEALRERGDSAQADAFAERHAGRLSIADDAKAARSLRRRAQSATLPFIFAGDGFYGTVHTKGVPKKGVTARKIKTEDERKAFIETIERDFIRALAGARK